MSSWRSKSTTETGPAVRFDELLSCAQTSQGSTLTKQGWAVAPGEQAERSREPRPTDWPAAAIVARPEVSGSDRCLYQTPDRAPTKNLNDTAATEPAEPDGLAVGPMRAPQKRQSPSRWTGFGGDAWWPGARPIGMPR